MAGFSQAYVVGPRNYDGVNPIELMLLQGDGERMWFQPLYVEKGLRPLGALNVLVPAGPTDPDALLDACIAFHPEPFRACPSLAAVEAALGRSKRLDVNDKSEGIGPLWAKLREEARPLFAKLTICQAKFAPLALGGG